MISSTPWTHAVAIAVVGLACYAHVLSAPFVFDDHSNIVQNPQIHVQGFDLPGLATATFESRSPRPVANLSFGINHAVCGLEVRCWRTVNVVIHLANGLLVQSIAAFLFLLLRPGNERAAWNLGLLAGLVFVAHPIQIQSVTYIVQRMTSLSTGFYLLAVWLWLQGRTRLDDPVRFRLWAGAAVSGLLAFGSKQIAVTLPLSLLLVEWLFFRDGRLDWLRKRAVPAAGLVSVAVLLGVAYLAWLGFPGYAERDFTLGERVLTQLRVVPFYVGLVLLPLPSRLNLIHDFEPSTSLFDPISTLFGGLFLAGLLVAGLVLARRERVFSFAILWFLLNLALESSVFPLELAYEHRLYLPMFGIALAVAEIVGRVARGRTIGLAAVGALLVVALAVGTHARNRVWNDAPTLWYDVAEKSPLDTRVYINLIHSLRAAKRLAEADAYLASVLGRYPDLADAWHSWAIVAEWDGRRDDARVRFAAAHRLAPDEPRYEMKIGLMLAEDGDLPGAIASLEALTQQHPDFASGWFALAGVLVRDGRDDDAAAAYQQTLRVNPDHGQAHYRVANHFLKQRAFEEALDHLREARRLDPHNPELRSLIRRVEAERDQDSGGTQ